MCVKRVVAFIDKIIYRKKVSKIYRQISYLFAQKNGIEIGGPSGIFKKYIPIYKIISTLDGCNFSTQTIWEGNLKEGNFYQWGNKTGFQYISEATNLKDIENNKYDFLVASHCLEHVSNPIKAVKEWIRVIKPNGTILLVLPNKEYCFDHKRSITKFDHLVSDYEQDVDETDLTHLDEIFALHDLSMDEAAGNMHQFKERSLKNYENRYLHHHVFNADLLKQLFQFLNIEIVATEETDNLNIVIVGVKKDTLL